MREIDFRDWKKHNGSTVLNTSLSLYVDLCMCYSDHQNTQKKYSFSCLFCFKEAEELLDSLNVKYVTCVTYGFSQMHTLIHLLGMWPVRAACSTFLLRKQIGKERNESRCRDKEESCSTCRSYIHLMHSAECTVCEMTLLKPNGDSKLLPRHIHSDSDAIITYFNLMSTTCFNYSVWCETTPS